MNIEIKWLQDFIVLSNTLNFSKASKLRFVTQPAFSRRIQALENHLKCQLFYRSQYPIELTHQGLIFKATASKILAELEKGICELQSNVRNELQIKFATTHTLSTGIFPRVAQHLASFNTHISTELKIADADDCIEMLTDKECDFLLSFSDPTLKARLKDSLFIEKVKLLPVCVCDDNGVPLYSLSNASQEIPYLAYKPDIYLGRVVKKLITQNKTDVNIVKRLESSMADNLKMMAIKGLGVAWVPEFSILDELKNKKLVICGDPKWQPELEVRMYYLNNSLLAHQEIWSYLKSVIKK